MELCLSFLISLGAILLACIFFSNSIEWLGVKLNLSHGITGSLLAAVGTALPETIVPLVAIFWGINRETLVKILIGKAEPTTSINEISIGAIIGAPFMLSTIAFFLIGLSSWLYFKSGRRKTREIKVDRTVLKRDLTFFIFSFSIAFLAIFLNHSLRIIIAIGLILIYILYIYQTIKGEKNSEYKGEELEENLDQFLLSKLIPSLKPSMPIVFLQLTFSLCFLIYSAHHFVEVIKEVSHTLNFPPFIISLLLTPLATELPEKFNSWVWIRQKKDTLAVGNVSGALVFQSTFPVSIGLLFTSWQVSSTISYLIFIFCLISTGIVLIALIKKRLTYRVFLLGGVFYLIYLATILIQFK